MVKEEAHVGHIPCADLHDSRLHHIKEEREEVCTSLGGEQLNGKEEIDAISLPVTATPTQNVNDKRSPLLLQLYSDQINGRELPEENNGEESIRIKDHGDGPIALKTEGTKKDDESCKLKHSGSGLKTKNMDNDWKESRAPESDENAADGKEGQREGETFGKGRPDWDSNPERQHQGL
ncbi:hypothetical protein CRENBAI_006336 [Crenichthys baileyi]|uniref:Prolactin receptor n=1 Tax=Crenichthys baileyi TaxID=28760 RepID=A0AAV9QSE7_9TELE